MSNFNLSTDSPESWSLGFQDSGSPIHEGIVDLHNRIIFHLIIILVVVTWSMSSVILRYHSSRNLLVYKYINHGSLIEVIWTLSPAVVLVSISFPSFRLLYMTDEIINPEVTIKVTGHQWYWSYEYSDFLNDIEFDSYLKPESDLFPGEFRLLEVDNRVVVPDGVELRFIVTSQDVVHDWAIPSLGIKVDSCPGRLNQVSTLVERSGVFYGQCSEICGVGHYAMPIVVESVSPSEFVTWIDKQ